MVEFLPERLTVTVLFLFQSLLKMLVMTEVFLQPTSLNNIQCKSIINVSAKILSLRLASQDQYVLFIFLYLFYESLLDF